MIAAALAALLVLPAAGAETACRPDAELESGVFRAKLAAAGAEAVDAELSFSRCSVLADSKSGALSERRSYRDKSGRVALLLIGRPGAEQLELEAVLSGGRQFPGASGWSALGGYSRALLLSKGLALPQAQFDNIGAEAKPPVLMSVELSRVLPEQISAKRPAL